MKKFGFTLLEILLSLGIFSLLIGIILSIYTKMQEAESKIINTQKMVQVAQDFSEKMFNWSLSCTWMKNNNGWWTILGCDEFNRSITRDRNKWQITAIRKDINTSTESSPRTSDSSVFVSDLDFDVNSLNNFVTMNITTKIKEWSWDYFTWLAIWTGWFTLTSSYYFGKVK